MMAIGRGVRFQHAYKTPHPVSILIYLKPGSRVEQADKKFLLRSTLAAVGHRVYSVQNSADVGQSITSGSYDLVLADVADIADLENELRLLPSRPLVIPVLYKVSKAEDSLAEIHYHWVVRARGNAGQMLVTIDAAIDDKLRKGERSIAQKM
jgi:hypothetical protein